METPKQIVKIARDMAYKELQANTINLLYLELWEVNKYLKELKEKYNEIIHCKYEEKTKKQFDKITTEINTTKLAIKKLHKKIEEINKDKYDLTTNADDFQDLTDKYIQEILKASTIIKLL